MRAFFPPPVLNVALTCDQAFFFSGERESVAARELVSPFSRPPTLALPHFRAPPKKRTPDRRLMWRSMDIRLTRPQSSFLTLSWGRFCVMRFHEIRFFTGTLSCESYSIHYRSKQHLNERLNYNWEERITC